MLYKFSILFLLSFLNYKIMSISSLSSSSSVQYIINNTSTYVYKHFKIHFVSFANLVNAYFDKIITLIHPNLTILRVKNMHFLQSLSIALAVLAYYAHCFCFPIMLA